MSIFFRLLLHALISLLSSNVRSHLVDISSCVLRASVKKSLTVKRQRTVQQALKLSQLRNARIVFYSTARKICRICSDMSIQLRGESVGYVRIYLFNSKENLSDMMGAVDSCTHRSYALCAQQIIPQSRPLLVPRYFKDLTGC